MIALAMQPSQAVMASEGDTLIHQGRLIATETGWLFRPCDLEVSLTVSASFQILDVLTRTEPRYVRFHGKKTDDGMITITELLAHSDIIPANCE